MNKNNNDKLREYDRFAELCVPYGWLDIKTAINLYLEVGKSSQDLYEDIEEYKDELDIRIEDVDVCYIAFENILQEARNHIERVLNYDFLNDNGGSINTLSNYCATTYDYYDEDREDLIEQIKSSSKWQKTEILEDDLTLKFLEMLDISESELK